ncbi:hypothetical protein, partial [Prosthecomicrobium pneumaticum]|uniref:hypothetical protein n=1 Tax=Prosthecomicrobium pneumaticum TaxID=81895 RepID=UPI001AEF2AA3
LNSRENFRRCICHLRLHETPNLGVHETGSRPQRPQAAGPAGAKREPEIGLDQDVQNRQICKTHIVIAAFS